MTAYASVRQEPAAYPAHPGAGDVYRTEFGRAAQRAFSMWNREPASPSYGSFDRVYWGWKYKDFGDATRQAAVTLAVGHCVAQGTTATLPPLLEAYVEHCRRIQRRDGSFDQCYPNERTPGVVYDMLPALVCVRRSPYLESADARRALDDVLERAVAFVLREDERHGEIANHIAEFAHALFVYAAHAGDARARARGETYLTRLLSLFVPEEGWFREYEGPDAGYQTRTLRYVVKCAALLEREALWETARRAADFLAAVLMPDGSVHPMLGTRSTALLFPSGFETLAAHDGRYAALAARVRAAWRDGRVPLPSWMDFDNALQLAQDAADAAEAYQAAASPSAEGALPELPPRTDFPKAGLVIVRRADHALYLAHALGGAVVAYRRGSDGRWTIAYEDAGYVARSSGGTVVWVSRAPGSGELLEATESRWVVRARFHRSLHDEMTPLRLVLLRVLNLTLLRFQWLGDLFRRIVVRRLMVGRTGSSLTLIREVVLERDRLRVADRVRDEAGAASLRPRLLRCRRSVGLHMASSRYFQPQEVELPDAWTRPVSWGKDEARDEVEVSLLEPR